MEKMEKEKGNEIGGERKKWNEKRTIQRKNGRKKGCAYHHSCAYDGFASFADCAPKAALLSSKMSEFKKFVYFQLRVVNEKKITYKVTV